MLLENIGFEPLYASLIATMGFGIVFSVPKRAIFSGGIIGMLGWSSYVYSTMVLNFDMVVATLVASIIVSFSSQILARIQKHPVTIFSIAGIIPLVPGGLAYDTMRYFVENNYDLALIAGARTLFISGAIACGLIFSGIISQTIGKKGYINAEKN